MKRKKKKIFRTKFGGFSLVEMLAIVVIIGILATIAIGAYSSHIARTRRKAIEAETKKLEDASSLFRRQFQRDSGYKENVSSNKRETCISVKSLIDKGFYDDTVKFLNKDIKKDQSVIKITEENGKASYKLLNTNQEIFEECYYTFSSNDSDVEVASVSSNKISLKTTIRPDAIDKYKYLLKINFSAQLYELQNFKIPVYVLIVMDSSSSMYNSANKYDKAMYAAIDLSSSIVNNSSGNEKTYVGLTSFGSNVSDVERAFKHEKLVETDFIKWSGTNVLAAFSRAKLRMRDEAVADETGIDPLKFVVFLTDGEPYAPDDYSDLRCYRWWDNDKNTQEDCKNALKIYTNNIKNQDTTLIIIGYEMGESDSSFAGLKAVYRETASKDSSLCSNSNYADPYGNSYCYFDSTSDSISTLFSDLSKNIDKKVKDTQISASKINVKFNDSIKLYDKDGNEVTNRTLAIDVDLNAAEDNINTNYSYYVKIGDLSSSNYGDCDETKDTCEYVADLFDTYDLVLYDQDGNVLATIPPETVPQIKVSRDIDNFIN